MENNLPTTPVAEQAPTPETQAAPPAPKVAPVRNKFAAEKKKRRLPKWIKWLIFIAIISGIGFGVYKLVGKFTAKEEKPVMTAFVNRGSLSASVSGYGIVVPKEKSDYGAKTRGKVTDVYVKAGDLVKPGDKLFSIDGSEILTDLDKARATLKDAQSKLKDALKNLSNVTTTSPFTGKLIDAKALKVGDTVSSGDKIGTLVDDSKMKLVLYFSHAYIDEIAVGMSATVSVPQSMSQVTGTVSAIDKIRKVSPDGSLLFRVTVSVNNPGTLTKDMGASATIDTSFGVATPYEAGVFDYITSQEITAKLSGTVTYANILDYGEYVAGSTFITVSDDGLDTAVSTAQKSVEDAQLKVTELESSISTTDIVADIEGMVSAIMVEVNDVLTASGTAVMSVSNTTSLFVDINIDEFDVNKVQVGMPATITFNNGEGTLQGTLTYVSFEAAKNQNNYGGGQVAYFPGKIAIENDGKLLPNMNVDFNIVHMSKDDCVIVPSTSVVLSEVGTVVFVKNEALTGEEKVAEIASEGIPAGFTPILVEIGIADAMNTEIISGVTEGQEIYTTPNMNNGGRPGYGGGTIMVG